MKTKIVSLLLGIWLIQPLANANFVTRGYFLASGDFTLNHLYSFSDPSAQPFGWWGEQTITSVHGVFSPYVHIGDTFNPGALWTDGPNLPVISLDGFTFYTTSPVNVSGADSMRYVSAFGTLTGNGYVQGNDFNTWGGFMPPYDISNFTHDITGEISGWGIGIAYDNGVVPDQGATILLFGLVLPILIWKKENRRL